MNYCSLVSNHVCVFPTAKSASNFVAILVCDDIISGLVVQLNIQIFQVEGVNDVGQ